MKYTSTDIVQRLELLRNKKLTEEELQNVDFWTECQQLKYTTTTDGWDVAINLLQSYVVKSIEDLSTIDPADNNSVNAGHCVFFVATRLLKIFKEDVQRMIDSSRENPKVVNEAINLQELPEPSDLEL